MRAGLYGRGGRAFAICLLGKKRGYRFTGWGIVTTRALLVLNVIGTAAIALVSGVANSMAPATAMGLADNRRAWACSY